MSQKQMKDIIFEHRKKQGMTQEELAERLHISNKTVSKWERGLGYPDITLVPSLADALQVPVAALFDADDLQVEAEDRRRKTDLAAYLRGAVLAVMLYLSALVICFLAVLSGEEDLILAGYIAGALLLLGSLIYFVWISMTYHSKSDGILEKLPLYRVIAIYALLWYIPLSVISYFSESPMAMLCTYIFFALPIWISIMRRGVVLPHLIQLFLSGAMLATGLVLMIWFDSIAWMLLVVASEMINLLAFTVARDLKKK